MVIVTWHRTGQFRTRRKSLDRWSQDKS